MDKGDDPYKILGVDKYATTSDIRKAYRKLALEHHPDKQTDEKSRAKAQHIFANISAAYEILSDDDERAAYDNLQKEQTKETGKARGFDQKKANTNVRFNDPYEVFKRDFEKQFGCAYPGAQYDFIEQPSKANNTKQQQQQQQFERLTNGQTKDKNSNSSSSKDNGGKSDGKKRGILSRFRRGGGNKNNNNDCKDLVVHDGSNKNNNKNSKALVVKGSKKNDDRMVEYDPSNRAPGDNRPVSMETTTKQIKHDDGTIETITEMKVTRPDGSTETFRQTDKAHKQPGWKGKSPTNQNKKLALTNGDTTKLKELTNGTNQMVIRK